MRLCGVYLGLYCNSDYAPLEKAITPVLCFLARPDNWDLPAGGEILKGLHLTFGATRFSTHYHKPSGAYYNPCANVQGS